MILIIDEWYIKFVLRKETNIMTTEKRNNTDSFKKVLFVLLLYALGGIIEEINLLNVVYFVVVCYGTIKYYIYRRSI